MVLVRSNRFITSNVFVRFKPRGDRHGDEIVELRKSKSV